MFHELGLVLSTDRECRRFKCLINITINITAPAEFRNGQQIAFFMDFNLICKCLNRICNRFQYLILHLNEATGSPGRLFIFSHHTGKYITDISCSFPFLYHHRPVLLNGAGYPLPGNILCRKNPYHPL